MKPTSAQQKRNDRGCELRPARQPAGSDRAMIFHLRQHGRQRLAAHRIDCAGPAFAEQRPGGRLLQFGTGDDFRCAERFESIGKFRPSGRGVNLVT